ncbi:MAG: elongation factor EF-2, partial [Methanosarcinales archaeon]|nr:elongation factor EF-2 [Methanosarcinales archaeon]
VEGKSPNRHNRFYIEVSPLEPEIVDMIKSGEIGMKMDKIERRDKLMEVGMGKDEAKSFSAISESNVLIDMTKGVQYLRETMELIIEGFEEATTAGPMSREPCQGLKLRLIDVKLHEDAVHRGPAQVIPAVRQAIQAAILMADVTLLEPFQKVFIQVPQDYMGGAISEIQGRRGAILNMTQEGDVTDIEAKTPVAELFGFAGDLRSATEGRALWSTEFAGFESLPKNLLPEIVSQIRTRKGLKPGIPKPSDFVSE